MVNVKTAAGVDKSYRDRAGQFLPGVRRGPAHGVPAKYRIWRETLAATITADDLAAVLRTMLDAAKSGDIVACREILDRCLGRPLQAHLIATDDGDDATRDPVSMIRELRAALGVHDEQPGQPGQPASVTDAVDVVDVDDVDDQADVPVVP